MADHGQAEESSPSRSSQTTCTPPSTTTETPLAVPVSGLRRIFLILSVMLGLFLSFLDTTIVSVALATIAGEFGDFGQSTWVINAYLLTYTGFAIILTRLSDIVGRKTIEVTSFLIFLAFSLACALSRSMTQLIIFRAIQGIGGSGLFSMTMVIAINAVPVKKRGAIAGAIGTVMVSSGVLGPILSGAITHNQHSSTWRWIFYLNLPVGGFALGLLLLAWPREEGRPPFDRKALSRVDFLGAVLLLAASILFIFALQEGGARIYQWRSSTIVTCFVISAIAFFLFVAWQKWLALHTDWQTKPIFPVHIAAQRVPGAAMLITLLTGFVYYIAVINLPQRFQIVDEDSPIIAGVKLMPMMASSAVGTLTAGSLNSRRNFTGITAVLASTFLLLGYGLMITLGDAHPTPTRQFGFQVFVGLGCGWSFTATTLIAQYNVAAKWIPVAQGAMTQMRTLGGSIGLAAGFIVLNNEIRSSNAIRASLTSGQISDLYKSPLLASTFPSREQELVAQAYAQAFTEEMRVATYMAVVAFVASLFTLQWNPPPPKDPGIEAEEELCVEKASQDTSFYAWMAKKCGLGVQSFPQRSCL